MTDIAVFVFAAWVGAICITGGTHPGMRLWIFMLLVPLYVIIRTSLQDRNMIRPLLCVIPAVVAVEAVWGLLQLYGVLPAYNKYVTGSFFNAGPYSGFLACGIPIALYFILNGSAKTERFLGLACIITAGLILPAAMSRAAWVAATAGCVPVLYRICFRRGFRFRFKHAAIAVAGCCLACALLTGTYMMRTRSADHRLFVWRVSAAMVSDRPVTGSGLGSFQALYDGAQANFFLSGKGTEKQKQLAGISHEYAFNEYIQVTVEHGITGLVLFMWIICLCLVPTSKETGAGKTAIQGSLTAFLVFAFFSYPFSVLPLAILFVVLAAMAASFSRPVERFPSRFSRVAAGVLCLGMSGYASVEILSRYPAYREWKSAQVSYYDAGHWEQAAEVYGSLYAKLDREKQYLFEYARCLSFTGQYTKSNETLDRYLLFGSNPVIYCSKANNYKSMNDYENAEQMYLRASEIVPNRPYPLRLLMNLYDETGQSEKAEALRKYFEAKRKKYLKNEK
jgi:O-antigen ligase